MYSPWCVWTVAGYVAGGWLEAGGRVLLFIEFVELTCLAFHLISSSITTLAPMLWYNYLSFHVIAQLT